MALMGSLCPSVGALVGEALLSETSPGNPEPRGGMGVSQKGPMQVSPG